MLTFTKTFKLYVFKDKASADLTIRVTKNYAQTFNISLVDLQEIVNTYDIGAGFNKNINGQFWLVQLKLCTPRPQTPNTYVRFSVYIGGVGHQYRIDPEDMLELKKDLFYQLNNKMYWDSE